MKIRTEFQEDSYNIYTEEVEQGFCEPCFFIQCLSQSEKDKLSERFLAQHSFVISYFPKKGNAECWQVQKKLQYLLYYITLEEGSLLRGTNRKGNITEGVLQFFVNYDFPMKYRILNFFHALHKKPFVPFIFVFFQHFLQKLLGQNTHKHQRYLLILMKKWRC